MTRRRARTALQRARLFEARGGTCHICGHRIDGTREPWDLDHIVPLALGGEDADANLAPAHASCHRAKGGKTSDDVKAIRKAERVRAKHMGAKGDARQPVGGWAARRFKRRLDGTVVRRDET